MVNQDPKYMTENYGSITPNWLQKTKYYGDVPGMQNKSLTVTEYLAWYLAFLRKM